MYVYTTKKSSQWVINYIAGKLKRMICFSEKKIAQKWVRFSSIKFRQKRKRKIIQYVEKWKLFRAKNISQKTNMISSLKCDSVMKKKWLLISVGT